MAKDIYNRLATDQSYIPIVETEDEMEQILAQIKMVLGTKKGDVLGAPYFGVNLNKYIFSLSYNQEEINQIVKEAILENIEYNHRKYSVDVQVDFGKDADNQSDYAVLNISINQKRCMGIMITQN